MWPALALVFLGCSVVLHLWWRARYQRLRSSSSKAIAELEGKQQEASSEFKAQQDAVFHDLGRLKRLENARQEFVPNVSHKLRTPLSLIKGYVETLLDGAKDNPEVATKFLLTIERNAERLKLLIEDLLTISELESGRVKLNLQEVRLHSTADKVFED